MKTFSRYLLIALTVLATCNFVQAQETKRDKLEKKQQELRAEIRHINDLLSSNKEKGQSIIAKVAGMKRRIDKIEELIRTNNVEANLLTDEINANQKKIADLKAQLKTLKDNYAKLIRKSYRSRSTQSRIMFLFSSSSFLQAYKRLQYLKQYADYRKKQGEKIKQKTKELEALNSKLTAQRKDKEELLAKNQATKKELESAKKEQVALMATIKANAALYKRQIKERRKKIAKIDAEIQKLVRAAIAKENAKKGSTSSTHFKLTPEAKALSASFKSNKGRLPWPVKSGNVVVRFGKDRSLQATNIPISSHGIRIQTNKLEPVHAVFDGKVLAIQVIRGAGKIVMVQHGSYISVYSNLAKINVMKDDIVSTGEIIGRVGPSTATGLPTLTFCIYKGFDALNPLSWILKR